MNQEKITLPTEPTALAKALLRHRGPAYAARVQEAIAEVLAEHQAKLEKTPSKNDRKRGPGASAKAS